jgi:hypothetical protein
VKIILILKKALDINFEEYRIIQNVSKRRQRLCKKNLCWKRLFLFTDNNKNKNNNNYYYYLISYFLALAGNYSPILEFSNQQD